MNWTTASAQSATESTVAVEQASAAIRAGDAAEAERILRQQLLRHPDAINVLSKLGDTLVGRRRDAEAIFLFKRALALAPHADGIRFALVQALRRENYRKAALHEIEHLSQNSRASFSACTLEAALLGEIGLHDRELALYEKLTAEYPNNENLWVNYGNALKTVGRTNEAVRALRRAIKVRPTFGAPYWSLANLKTYRFDDREVAGMLRALRRRLGQADALAFHFALGKALEDRGETEESFKHYAAGNRIRASQATPAQMCLTPRVDAVMRTFTRDLFRSYAGAGCKESARYSSSACSAPDRL
jgi:predicted Zn-dependent protease